MDRPKKLNRDILAAALLGLEERRKHIDAKIAEVRAALQLTNTPTGKAIAAAAPRPSNRKRRKLSPAARKRIAEGQKKRWAAFRAQKGQES